MLFNSFPFLLVYLPITVIGFFSLARFGHLIALNWLTFMSIVFYTWWDVSNLPILLGSVAWNFIFARAICNSQSLKRRHRLLIVGVAGDILALIIYKYLNLFVSTLVHIYGLNFGMNAISLPLGISFFTFTQIAFLIDAYKDKIKDPSLRIYLLFVSYFPHLIAGPIIHHRDVIPQFRDPTILKPCVANFGLGFSIFTIGLIKKVVLADLISPNVGFIFDAAKQSHLTFFEAWLAALSYTVQLYFDFSGYSDMAVGLSLLFGIWLPFNFNSPYKSTSIIDFWHRWHITLSQFLREYLYILLGGNRHGNFRKYINLMIVMALGGFWHGANWTFLLWGILHGVFLIVNHAINSVKTKFYFTKSSWWFSLGGWLCTFVAVVFAWVLFRAETLPHALGLWSSMIDLKSIANANIQGYFPNLTSITGYLVVIPILVLALVAPNTQTIFRVEKQRMNCPNYQIDQFSRIIWKPTLPWAIGFGLMFVVGLLSLFNVSEFIYFNF